MTVRPIPDGYHAVTPYLVVPGVAELIDFLVRAFGAEETERREGPDGAVVHAQVRIGDSFVMMGESRGEYGPMPTCLYLYCTDTDVEYRRALAAGGTSVQEPQDMFYGDRNAGVKDPAGNLWFIATRIEDLTPEEIRRRAESMGRQS